MNGKEILKWGLIVIAALMGWRLLNAGITGISGRLSGSVAADNGMSYGVPDYYGVGVYPQAPSSVTYWSNQNNTNPFYSSPMGRARGGPARGYGPRN